MPYDSVTVKTDGVRHLSQGGARIEDLRERGAVTKQIIKICPSTMHSTNNDRVYGLGSRA